MSDPQELRPARATPLWVRILLGASLAVNLLVAGIVLGAALNGGRGADAAGRAPGDAPFIRALDRDDRRELARDLRRSGELRPLLARRARLAREETLLASLRADAFDRAAAERVLTEQRAEGAARQDLGMRLLLDHLEEMPAEKRRAYADRLEALLSQGPRG